MTTMPKAGKYIHREPVRAMQFGPKYWDAFTCYEWVLSMGGDAEVDNILTRMSIGRTIETQIAVAEGWWVVWEDDKFHVYTDEKFNAKFKKLPEPLTYVCSDHKPVQHRDMKEPWCNRCGLNAVGKLPSVGNTNLIHQKND